MPSIQLRIIVLFVGFLLFFSSVTNVVSKVEAEDNPLHEAYFINSFSDLKIYEKDVIDISFAIRNKNSSEEIFIVNIFRNNLLVYRGNISCGRGSSTDYTNLTISEGWIGPSIYEVTIELRTFTGILQDLRRFSVYVVKLTISDWSYSVGMIVAHSKKNETLSIGFRNGGNSIMYNVRIAAKDKQFFDITPGSIDIGNIPAGGAKNIALNIKSLDSTEPGNYSLKFLLNYEDFKGTIHTEDKFIPITVIELGTKIILNYSSNIKYGNKIILSANLFNANNESIKNGTIVFYIGSNKIGEVQTNTAGIGRLEYTPSDHLLDVGSYEINATYQGSRFLKNSNAIGSLIIIPLQTFLDIEVPTPILAKEITSFKLILRDENRIAIPNEPLILFLDESKIINSTTDIDGILMVNYTFPKIGSHLIKAAYSGGKNYLKTESNIEKIKVNPMETRLFLDVDSVLTKGGVATIKVKLEDKHGIRIKDAKIHLFLNGERLQSLVTNEDGVKSYSYQFNSAGILKETSISAEYGGDEAYAKSLIRKNITIIDLYMIITLIVLVIVVATVILIVFIELRKRRTLPPAKTKADTIEEKVCPECRGKISSSDTYCPFCGKEIESKMMQTQISDTKLEEIDEKVYDYIVERKGTISWEKAPKELNMSLEDLRKSVEKLKKSGRIAQADSDVEP